MEKKKKSSHIDKPTAIELEWFSLFYLSIKFLASSNLVLVQPSSSLSSNLQLGFYKIEIGNIFTVDDSDPNHFLVLLSSFNRTWVNMNKHLCFSDTILQAKTDQLPQILMSSSVYNKVVVDYCWGFGALSVATGSNW